MKKLITATLAGLLFVSCAPSTPQARIQSNPEKFAALTSKEKNLVREGQLARGMSPDAVEIAWGRPSERFEGNKNQRSTERWDYAGSRPVYTTNFFGGYGSGYGPYRHGHYSTLGFGLGPEVAYVPYRVASVWFVSGRVESWERVR